METNSQGIQALLWNIKTQFENETLQIEVIGKKNLKN